MCLVGASHADEKKKKNETKFEKSKMKKIKGKPLLQ